MIPKTIIHLLSGGFDSTVLLYDLIDQGHNVHCILFDYGQRHLKELDFAKWHCKWQKIGFTLKKIEQLRGSELTDGSGGVIVPMRNPTFLDYAVNLAVEARADTVTIGCNNDDEATFPDCRPAFFQIYNTMLTTIEIPVEVCTPYISWPKWKIGAKAQDMRVPIKETWSCYRGGTTPCGECPACIKREAALNR